MNDIKKSVFENKITLYVLFVGIFIGRLFLLGDGHLDDTDEIPFLHLINNFEKLISFDKIAWGEQIFVVRSTYFETLSRLAQYYLLDLYSDKINMPIESVQSLTIVGLFNLIIATLVLFFIYKILIRISFDNFFALLGVLIYVSFFNTNMYIRHINSYEAALLIYLIAIYILLKRDIFLRDFILSGALTAVGFFYFYGYYMMFLVIWIIGIGRLTNRNLKEIGKATFCLSFPAVLLFIILEFISLRLGYSYFKYLVGFSKTIFHGSSDEALIYAYVYLKTVDGIWGFFILALFILGLLYAFFYKKSYSKLSLLFLLSGLIAYFAYGSYAFFSKEMVFYGRVFHMYYVFIVISVLYVLQKHKRIAIGMFFASLLAFIFNIKELLAIGYPRSTVYQYSLFDNGTNLTFVNELEPAIIYSNKLLYFGDHKPDLPEFKLIPTNSEPKIEGELILKNFAFFFHYPDEFVDSYLPFNVTDNYEKIFEKKHFMSHPAYTFEYCTRFGREFFIEKNFKFEIYRKKT